MTNVDSVTVAYSRKVQLNDFEPIEHFAEVEVSLSDEDDPDEVYDEYSERVESMVERGIANRLAASEIDADGDE